MFALQMSKRNSLQIRKEDDAVNPFDPKKDVWNTDFKGTFIAGDNITYMK